MLWRGDKSRVLLLLWLTSLHLFIQSSIYAAIDQGVIRPRTPPCFYSSINRLQTAETKKQGKIMIWKSAFCKWGSCTSINFPRLKCTQCNVMMRDERVALPGASLSTKRRLQMCR